MAYHQYVCICCGNDDPSVSHFPFPEKRKRQEKWLAIINRPFLKVGGKSKYTICVDHFAPEAFKTTEIGRPKLRKKAVPSVNIDLKPEDILLDNSKRCYICGRIKIHRSVHRFPKDNKLRAKWLKNLGIKYDSSEDFLRKDRRICSAHFSKKDIKIDSSKRRILKTGAIPLPAIIEIENGENEAVIETGNDCTIVDKPPEMIDLTNTDDLSPQEDIDVSEENLQENQLPEGFEEKIREWVFRKKKPAPKRVANVGSDESDDEDIERGVIVCKKSTKKRLRVLDS